MAEVIGKRVYREFPTRAEARAAIEEVIKTGRRVFVFAYGHKKGGGWIVSLVAEGFGIPKPFEYAETVLVKDTLHAPVDLAAELEKI